MLRSSMLLYYVLCKEEADLKVAQETALILATHFIARVMCPSIA